LSASGQISRDPGRPLSTNEALVMEIEALPQGNLALTGPTGQRFPGTFPVSGK